MTTQPATGEMVASVDLQKIADAVLALGDGWEQFENGPRCLLLHRKDHQGWLQTIYLEANPSAPEYQPLYVSIGERQDKGHPEMAGVVGTPINRRALETIWRCLDTPAHDADTNEAAG